MAPGQRGLPTPIFDALIAGSLVSAGYTEISISPGFSIRGFDATLVAPPPPAGRSDPASGERAARAWGAGDAPDAAQATGIRFDRAGAKL